MNEPEGMITRCGEGEREREEGEGGSEGERYAVSVYKGQVCGECVGCHVVVSRCGVVEV